jgi:methionine-rich copper-binding protein CopC
MVASPAVAWAHANLAKSDPQANARIDTSPSQVQLTFTERPDPRLSQIQVFDQRRQAIPHGTLAPGPGDPLTLVAPLPNLPPGIYTVSWHVTSADDGHDTSGAFAFGIGVAPSPADVALPPEVVPPPPSPLTMAARALTYLAALGLFGLYVFRLTALRSVWDGSLVEGHISRQLLERATNRCGSLTQVFAGLAVLAALGMVLDQAWRSTGHVGPDALLATLVTGLGRTLAARGVVALAILGILTCSLPAPRRPAHRSLGAAATSTMARMPASANVASGVTIALMLVELLIVRSAAMLSAQRRCRT